MEENKNNFPSNNSPQEPDTYSEVQKIVDGTNLIEPKQPRSKRTTFFIAGISFLAILMVSMLIALALTANKQQSENSETSQFNGESIITAIPEDWEDLDTGYGYKLKAPQGWDLEAKDPVTYLGIEEENSNLSPPPEDSSDSSEEESELVDKTLALKNEMAIQIGSLQFTEGGDVTAFEKAATELDEIDYKRIQNSQGVKREDIKIESARVKINETEWIKVDISTPKKLTRSYYQWKNDKAAVLTLTSNTTDPTKLSEYVKTYLDPIAASVTFDDSEEE